MIKIEIGTFTSQTRQVREQALSRKAFRESYVEAIEAK
jgi:hypothetical protein